MLIPVKETLNVKTKTPISAVTWGSMLPVRICLQGSNWKVHGNIAAKQGRASIGSALFHSNDTHAEKGEYHETG
jgi:hypothetical protein